MGSSLARFKGRASAVALRERLKVSAEAVAWIGLLPALALTLALFKWVTPQLGPDLLPAPQYAFFPEWQFMVRPEPVEELRFLIAAAMPVLLAVVVLVLGTISPSRRSFDPLIISIQVAGLTFVVWSLAQQVGAGFPADDLLLSVPNLIAGAVIGVNLTVLLLRPPACPRLIDLTGRLRGRPGIAFGIAALLTALLLLPAVTTDSTIGSSNLIPAGHIPVVFEDYMAVTNGRTPLVNYVPLYATLLPLAFGPLLPIFNNSITSFSIIECLLSLGGLMAVYLAFVNITRRPWAALGLYVPFLAISLFPWSEHGPVREFNGNYYALLPNRYLGPFLVAWLWARRARRGSPPVWVIFFVAGLTLLNNFEFGSACLAALVTTALLSANRSIGLGRSLGAGVQALAGLLGALALLSATTLLRADELPDLSLLIYWSRIFGLEAFGLWPMPSFGLHWALYFTYVGAVLVAAVRYVGAAPGRVLTQMLCFAGVFGLGTGQYFAGRSGPYQLMGLFPVWGFALALLAWTIALALLSQRTDPGRRRLIVAALAVMTGFGVMISGINRFPVPWQQLNRLSDSGPAMYDLPEQQRFVAEHTHPGERVLILATPVDHRIAERAGVINTSPWSSVIALLSPQEVNRAIDSLQVEGGRKVFEYAKVSSVDLPEVRQILRERGYKRVATDPVSGLREWEPR